VVLRRISNQADRFSHPLGRWWLAGYVALFAGLVLCAGPVDELVFRVLPRESADRMVEHASKLFIVLTIFAAICAYGRSASGPERRTSVAFVCLGVLLFAFESDYMRDSGQPLLAVIAMTATLVAVVRERRWIVAATFCIGCAALAACGLVDLVEQGDLDLGETAGSLAECLGEETIEAAGAAVVGLAAVLYARRALGTLGGQGICLLVGAACLLAVGSGLMTWEFEDRAVRGAGGATALLGVALAILTNRRGLPAGARLRLPTEAHFDLFLVWFFLATPLVSGTPEKYVHSAFWLLLVLVGGVLLVRVAPANGPAGRPGRDPGRPASM
jgi:hypothetical protein